MFGKSSVFQNLRVETQSTRIIPNGKAYIAIGLGFKSSFVILFTKRRIRQIPNHLSILTKNQKINQTENNSHFTHSYQRRTSWTRGKFWRKWMSLEHVEWRSSLVLLKISCFSVVGISDFSSSIDLGVLWKTISRVCKNSKTLIIKTRAWLQNHYWIHAPATFLVKGNRNLCLKHV